ncbi:hypothetical protein [Herbaspirillum sp.]|uniref:hypothetical protein n=1 Tax=Herbaspirillum TaxID=963 RepID=UPI002582AE0D|nr:hypothetical protein [Herbaspirillum sp.]MCP3657875.1 hypothetical protein [Herbaspirillum sp.]MCP3946406.1 hypothetical protein [Herbaspirillum sp.]MCP4029614.1 hypothetical protein [Herbaspirillum sp.]MCP4554136.1 hypothetical protein [Herbaspirillum sp.]
MRVYDDLIAVKGNGTPFDKLERVDSRKLVQTSASTGSLPTDYISFLAEVGFGEFGSAGYMLYDGLLEPYEVYGDTPVHLRDVLLFGDDFLGFNTGYKTDTWSVIEIDPTNMLPTVIAPDFSTFIRKKIHELTLTRE